MTPTDTKPLLLDHVDARPVTADENTQLDDRKALVKLDPDHPVVVPDQLPCRTRIAGLPQPQNSGGWAACADVHDIRCDRFYSSSSPCN